MGPRLAESSHYRQAGTSRCTGVFLGSAAFGGFNSSVEPTAQIESALELLRQLGVEARHEHLGGSGGGLCKLRGKPVYFVDVDADPATQADRCMAALASFPEVERLHLPPFMRERIESLRA